MSTYYTTTALIGVKISLNPKRFRSTKVEQSCEHAERIGQKFCPKCGQYSTDHSFTEWNTSDITNSLECGQPENFVLYEKLQGNENMLYLGCGMSVDPVHSDGADSMPIPDVSAIKKTLIALLSPHDLWDEKDFGFHMVTTYS